MEEHFINILPIIIGKRRSKRSNDCPIDDFIGDLKGESFDQILRVLGCFLNMSGAENLMIF